LALENPRLKLNLTASRFALLFVLIVAGGSLVWWVRHRPSYLIYQANSAFGKSNQAAVIAEYQRLLRQKNLPPAEEIKMRKALAIFYLDAIDSNSLSAVSYVDDVEYIDPRDLSLRKLRYKVEEGGDHPFIALAKNEVDRIFELSPHDAQAYYLLGWILWKKKLEIHAIEI